MSTQVSYYHGGTPGLKVILPPTVSGATKFTARFYHRGRVYLSRNPDTCLWYALKYGPEGTVYRVETEGAAPDQFSAPSEDGWQADSARIVGIRRQVGEELYADVTRAIEAACEALSDRDLPTSHPYVFGELEAQRSQLFTGNGPFAHIGFRVRPANSGAGAP